MDESTSVIVPAGGNNISPGPQYEEEDEFNLFSGSVKIAAQQTPGAAPPAATRTVTRDIPSGSRIWVKSVSIQVIAGPADQLLWTLIRMVQSFPYYQLNVSAMQQLGLTPISKIYEPPGPLAVDIINISNTNYSGPNGQPAGQAYDVTVQVTVLASLLVLRDRAKRMGF